MEWIIDLLRDHPELAIFLTLALGFWIGKIKIGSFSLGVVTSVLLVGVLVGQLDIQVGGPLKSVFFLLFLFAIGYKVGPQFFRGLKKDGLPQVYFAVLMCVSCLLVTWLLAKMMGYNAGEAAGLLSGAQTISAVIGVAGDTIQNLDISHSAQQQMINIIPVAYAVTYIFGTAGSAWILGSLGPRMLGGLDKVKRACHELESKMGNNDKADEPDRWCSVPTRWRTPGLPEARLWPSWKPTYCSRASASLWSVCARGRTSWTTYPPTSP